MAYAQNVPSCDPFKDLLWPLGYYILSWFSKYLGHFLFFLQQALQTNGLNIGLKLNQLLLESNHHASQPLLSQGNDGHGFQGLDMLDLQDSNWETKTNNNYLGSLDSVNLELLQTNESKDHNTRDVNLDEEEEVPTKEDLDKIESKDHSTRDVTVDEEEKIPTNENLDKIESKDHSTRDVTVDEEEKVPTNENLDKNESKDHSTRDVTVDEEEKVPTNEDLDKKESKDRNTRDVSLDEEEEIPTKEDLDKAASMGISTKTFKTVRNLLLNTAGIDLITGSGTEDSEESPEETVENKVKDREERSFKCPESPPGVVCIIYR